MRASGLFKFLGVFMSFKTPKQNETIIKRYQHDTLRPNKEYKKKLHRHHHR